MPSKDFRIQPMSEEQVGVLRKAATSLKDLLPEDPEVSSLGKKRKMVATEATDWREELIQGNLAKFTVDQLKEALVAYGKKKGSGKKEAVIARLTEAIQEDAAN
jgi:gamma-glutamyl phosphate reductase